MHTNDTRLLKQDGSGYKDARNDIHRNGEYAYKQHEISFFKWIYH